MSELDREPSFVEGLDQGYELGYLKALNRLAKYIEELKEGADADDMLLQEIPFVPFPDMDFMEVRKEG